MSSARTTSWSPATGAQAAAVVALPVAEADVVGVDGEQAERTMTDAATAARIP
jgi:hypothetical protein